jgi:hypothetical protein
MRFSNRNHTLALCLLLLSLALTACGAAKTSNTNSGSNTGTVPGVTYPGAKLSECNRITTTNSVIEGQVGTFYDPVTRRYVADYINMNLTTVPAQVFTDAAFRIYFLRWYQRTTGTKQTNQIPVRFYYVDKLTGSKHPSSATLENINKENLTAARTSFAWSSNVTLEKFFERAALVLTGLDMSWDAMSIMISTGAGAGSYGDVLLPPFYSNPVTYRTAIPVSSLYILHPHYAHINSNATENDYFQMTQSICSELAGVGARIPASVKPQTDTPRAQGSPPEFARGEAQPEPSLLRKIWNRILESLPE